jgi:hypothetical protein
MRQDEEGLVLEYQQMETAEFPKLTVYVWNNYISIEIKVDEKIYYRGLYPTILQENPRLRFSQRLAEDQARYGAGTACRSYSLDKPCIYDIITAHNSLREDDDKALSQLSALGYVNHLLIAGGLGKTSSHPYLKFALRSASASGILFCFSKEKTTLILGILLAVPTGLTYLYKNISPRIRKRELPSCTTVLEYEDKILKPAAQAKQRCCPLREDKHYHRCDQKLKNILNTCLGLFFILVGGILYIDNDEYNRAGSIFAIIYGILSSILCWDRTQTTPEHDRIIEMDDQEETEPLSMNLPRLVITTPALRPENHSKNQTELAELR